MADSQADSVQSPIIMKVDGPSEENENNGNEVNTESEIGALICSPSRSGFEPNHIFGSKVSSTSTSYNDSDGSRSILRPSQLSKQIVSSSCKPFALNPSKLNPFFRVSTSSDDIESGNSTECENGDSPKFVPLITSSGDHIKSQNSTSRTSPNAANNMPLKASGSPNFVFGQNLQERVTNEANSTCPDSSSDECRPSTSLSSNGTAMHKDEMLFSSAIKEAPIHESRTPVKSLTESAREYEEQRNNKRKYEEVETKTGEEDEINVMQVSCKLFAYDKSVGNWQERGRGILRLNDLIVNDCDESASGKQSRLVFRNSGVHKVILNTKIWAEMTIEQASAKSIRLTAIDTAGEIRVFLVMASADEIKHLFQSLIERRSNELKRQHGAGKRSAQAATDNSVSTTSVKQEQDAMAQMPDGCEGQQCMTNDDQEAECNQTNTGGSCFDCSHQNSL